MIGESPLGKAHTKIFIFSTRLVCAVSALLIALGASAFSQDRNSLVRRCLSIVDVNERVDCLESSDAPDSETTSTPKTKPVRQQGVPPSFDCRAASNSIERAICGDVTLSEWDSRMGQLFQQSLRLTKDRQSLLESQRLWLAQRDAGCGALADTAIWSCLLEMTKSRAAALTKVTATAAEVAQAVLPPPAPTTLSGRTELSANGAPVSPSDLSASQVAQNDRSKGASSPEGGFPITVSLIALAFGLTLALKVFSNIRRKKRLAQEQQRLEERRLAEVSRLVMKYGEEITARIIARQVWQGMTDEQLIESWGNPADVGREIIKARIYARAVVRCPNN